MHGPVGVVGWTQMSRLTVPAPCLTRDLSFTQIRTSLVSASLSHPSGSRASPALRGCVGRRAATLLLPLLR